MKFIDPSFEILTDISDGGIKELQHIERCARVSYRSEDKITPDGKSAEKMVKMLIQNGHESCLEHGSVTVEFTIDRAIANELVRHRMASFTQESTRYCNYTKDKFGSDAACILPLYLKHGYTLYNKLEEEMIQDDEYNAIDESTHLVFDYITYKYGGPEGMDKNDWDDICKAYNYISAAEFAVTNYKASVAKIYTESTPEEARWMLPLGLATKIVVTANYREWRHIFKLRCEKHAHPEMRRIMCSLWLVLSCKIPVIFDDIRDLVIDYLNQNDIENVSDALKIARKYFDKPIKEDL